MKQNHTRLITPSQLNGKQLVVSLPNNHQERYCLARPLLCLGRASHNDIVINSSIVSRHHAMLSWEKESYYISDGQVINKQHYPSRYGLYLPDGQRIVKHKLAHGDSIHIPDSNGKLVTLIFFDKQCLQNGNGIKQLPLHQEVRIGRGTHNELSLDDPLVSSYHVAILPVKGNHVLRDLNSTNGTFLNGHRIQKAILEPGQIIHIGSMRFEYNGSALLFTDPRYRGFRLDAINIHKGVKLKKNVFKILLDDISFSIEPHEFVAIVGGSGAGKSMLLDALNGFRPAQKGQVLINGDDIYQHFDTYRQTIGYVPQDDIIHRDLTVAEALRFVARLRLPPDTKADEIDRGIDATLKLVAMFDKKILLIKELSGGQRKRISIAVELIADPGILFLDEPTSGLDPGLDKEIMLTLLKVANAGKTVILVTHATSNITQCDLVAFMAVGGRLVFFGPPDEALTFFGVHDFADIYNLVKEKPNRWHSAFKASKYYSIYIRKRHQSMRKRVLSHVPEAKESLIKQLVMVRQLTILSQRYLTLLLRDQRHFLFLLLQSPVIALLLYMIVDAGIFNKGENTHPDDYVNIQTTLFMMACTATWFGVINSVREIVKELPIYRRERLVNLSIPAYVSSKLVVLLGLSIVQSLLFVLIVNHRVDFPWDGVLLPAPLEIFLTMSLMTFTSACFGLLLSAVVGREDRVMSIIPFFLVPQVMFAGTVFTLAGIPELISAFVFSRWGIEAFGAIMNMPALSDNVARVYGIEPPKLHFPYTHTTSYLLQKWGILLAFALLSIMLTIVVLKRQDIN